MEKKRYLNEILDDVENVKISPMQPTLLKNTKKLFLPIKKLYTHRTAIYIKIPSKNEVSRMNERRKKLMMIFTTI